MGNIRGTGVEHIRAGGNAPLNLEPIGITRHVIVARDRCTVELRELPPAERNRLTQKLGNVGAVEVARSVTTEDDVWRDFAINLGGAVIRELAQVNGNLIDSRNSSPVFPLSI